MYCKYCGKEIANDSKFCCHCGMQVNELAKSSDIQLNTEEEQLSPAVSIEDKKTIKIDVVKNETIKESTIANEVIANIKMICYALTTIVLFMIGFYAYHAQDIKPMDDNSYFGESCYDKTLSGNWEFSWEIHYYKEILAILPYSEWSDLQRKMRVPEYDYSKSPILINYESKTALELAGKEAQSKHIPEDLQEVLKKKAQEAAQNDKEDFRNVITEQREFLFEKDRNLSLKWCTIISLCVFIVGRYLIRFAKWVSINKTENK